MSKLTTQMVEVLVKYNSDDIKKQNKLYKRVLKSFSEYDYTKEEMKEISKMVSL